MREDVRPDSGEGIGGLSGVGASQLALSMAMRARDVSRPRPEHRAAAGRAAADPPPERPPERSG